MGACLAGMPVLQRWSCDVAPLPVTVEVSRFAGASGVAEYHLTLAPTAYGNTETQLDWLWEAYRVALASCGLDAASAVFRRLFCSDLPNQHAALETRPFADPRHAAEPCAVSWVGQPPIPPAKAILWAYHVADPAGALDKTQHGSSVELRRGELAHHWTTNITSSREDSSYAQTQAVLDEYERYLRARGLSLADHVVRTWFFVQNVDANYQGLVAARRELFTERGLTPETHYIASTGIEGRHADVAAKVALDAYAVEGLRPEQVEYLAAPENLSPTHVYGVTFERGAAVSYADRRHVIISGTASIDCHGAILHPGDVARQLDRTLDNVAALLAQAGATLDDMAVFLVYVRDPADYEFAREAMRARFGSAPVTVVLAPVCRPGWLIEVEGVALIPAARPELPPF